MLIVLGTVDSLNICNWSGFHRILNFFVLQVFHSSRTMNIGASGDGVSGDKDNNNAVVDSGNLFSL